MRSAAEDVPPPVPPVPLQYLNGKDTKKYDKDKDREKERKEERSSKEFDRRPSLWFKRRTAKPTKEEKEPKGSKDKHMGARGHATMSAAVLSQSDVASSCRVLACYGVVVVHVLAIMSSGSLALAPTVA